MSRPDNSTSREDLRRFVVASRIAEINNIEKIRKWQSKHPDAEVSENENYREPLSIDKKLEINILLSWGGPSDGFKLLFDDERELVSGVYWYADWGTYDEAQLDKEEMELVYDFYLYGDIRSFLGE